MGGALSFVDSPVARVWPSVGDRRTADPSRPSSRSQQVVPTGRQDPLRIVFAGTPAPAVPSLAALLESTHEVVGAVTRPPARRGRGRTLSPSPVAELAAEAGLPVLTPASARAPQFADELAALRPDAAAVVAYGALLPRPVLDVPPHGWINLHFSLLPAWRGASPVQAAIRAGDDITGATTFRLEEGMDTGPVYGIVTEEIKAGRHRGRPARPAGRRPARRCCSRPWTASPNGTLAPRPQSADGVSYAGKVTAADARVLWSNPAIAIDRLIRSVTPDPGAWTETPWGRMLLGPVQVTQRSDLVPGELAVGKTEVLVGTATSAVRLGTLTPPGRRAMAAADWARGVRPKPGTVLS